MSPGGAEDRLGDPLGVDHRVLFQHPLDLPGGHIPGCGSQDQGGDDDVQEEDDLQAPDVSVLAGGGDVVAGMLAHGCVAFRCGLSSEYVNDSGVSIFRVERNV